MNEETIGTPEAKPAWQASLDARDWAKEFMRINAGRLVENFGGPPRDGALVDEATMVGWFANALMRGRDEAHWKLHKELVRLAEWAHLNLYGGEPKEWRALPTVSGVLGQLDNMLAGMGPKKPALERQLRELENEFVRHQGTTMELSVDAEQLRDDLRKTQYNWNVDLKELKDRVAGLEASLRTHPDAAGDLLSTDLARVGFVHGLVFQVAGQLDKRIGELGERVHYCETQLPQPGDRTLGTMHAEVCARLSELEEKTRCGTTVANEDLSVRCARAELRVEELEKSLDHQTKMNRLVGEGYQRMRDKCDRLKEAAKKWGDQAIKAHGLLYPDSPVTEVLRGKLEEDLK